VTIAGLVVAPNVALAALACLFVGATTMAFMSGTNAALQVYAAPNMRGRVMGLFTVVFLGTTPLGAPLVGWISEVMGARTGIAFGGAAVAVAAVLGVRALRQPAAAPAAAVPEDRPREREPVGGSAPERRPGEATAPSAA
jgi:MFS family permease